MEARLRQTEKIFHYRTFRVREIVLFWFTLKMIQVQYKVGMKNLGRNPDKDKQWKDTDNTSTIQVRYKQDARTIQVQYKIDLNEIDKRNPDRLGENEENIKTKDNF